MLTSLILGDVLTDTVQGVSLIFDTGQIFTLIKI